MKAAQLVAPGRFEVVEVDQPTPGPGQVLLKVQAAGVCGSDVHLVHRGAGALPLPQTLGHETTARVVETNGAPNLQVDQAVLVAGIWGCMACRPCRLGRVNACETWARISPLPLGPGLGFPGGMAEYMVAPQTALVDLGDLDPIAAAPLADAGITPAHAISLVRSSLTPNATVLVIGIGGLGHMALQILRATTAARIVAVDTDPVRVESASAYGADVALLSDAGTVSAVRDLTDGLGAEVVLDFVGVDATLKTAISCVRTYGAIVAVGLGGGRLPFTAGGAPGVDGPPWGVNVVRPYGATLDDVFDVVALARSGRLTAFVETYPLEQAPEILEKLEVGGVQGRAVLIP